MLLFIRELIMAGYVDHPEAKTFLNDIIAHPKDDAVRLIYADWLGDHAGQDCDTRRDFDARAEFIRTQVELAQHENKIIELQKKESALLHEHGDHWRQEVLGGQPWDHRYYQYTNHRTDTGLKPEQRPETFLNIFRRGFLEHAVLNNNVRNADRLLSEWMEKTPITTLQARQNEVADLCRAAADNPDIDSKLKRLERVEITSRDRFNNNQYNTLIQQGIPQLKWVESTLPGGDTVFIGARDADVPYPQVINVISRGRFDVPESHATHNHTGRIIR